MSQVARVKSSPSIKNKSSSDSAKKAPARSQKGGVGVTKVRTFHNKKKTRKSQKVKGDEKENKDANGKEEAPQNTNTNTKKRTKRTLANFYQKQSHANVCYSTTKGSIKEQLGYVLRKYPPQKLAASWEHLNRQVIPRYPPSSFKKKESNNDIDNNKKRKLPDWTVAPPEISGFQLSQEAMDMIWLTTCKTVDNVLTKASEIATRCKAQTVTDIHICQAYQDLCKMRIGGE
jgi:hypothetical protein